jgi:mycofactocin precursor
VEETEMTAQQQLDTQADATQDDTLIEDVSIDGMCGVY